MKFYSEILDKLFETQEELIKKENEAKNILAQEKKQVQIKKKRADLLKEVDEKRNLVRTTFEAYQRADIAFKVAVRKLKQFDKENNDESKFDLDDFESIFDAVLDIIN